MKFFIQITLTFLILFKSANAITCTEAKMDEKLFFDASFGAMINVAKSRISPSMQNQKIEQILFDCVDVEKVSKRVLGRAKWQELSEDEKRKFLIEYPKYFIETFKDITLASLAGVEDFSFRRIGTTSSYVVSLKYAEKSQKNLELVMNIEEKNGSLKITDGKFAEISILTLQKQMFDRLYDFNPNVIKEFRAVNYITK